MIISEVQLVEPEGVARVQNTEEIIAFCPIFSAAKVRLKLTTENVCKSTVRSIKK
jgi:hypothetical protein